MQIKEEHDWSAYATEHDCRVIKTSDSREWASVGLTGHPRVGASAPREKWRCADGTVHWRDKFYPRERHQSKFDNRGPRSAPFGARRERQYGAVDKSRYHNEPLHQSSMLVQIVAGQRLDPVRPEDSEHSETAAEPGKRADQSN
jgi:hypothetical protein